MSSRDDNTGATRIIIALSSVFRPDTATTTTTTGIISDDEKGPAWCFGRIKVTRGSYILLMSAAFARVRLSRGTTATRPSRPVDIRSTNVSLQITTYRPPGLGYLFAVNRRRRLVVFENWTFDSPATNPGPRGSDTRRTPTLVSAIELHQKHDTIKTPRPLNTTVSSVTAIIDVRE